MRSLICMIAYMLVAGCVGSQCGNEVLSEAASPDIKYVATVFERNCGATAPYARVVSIRPVGSEFDGNDMGEYVFTMQGQHDVTVQWTTANRLVIRRPAITGDIFKEVHNWKDVEVVTEP